MKTTFDNRELCHVWAQQSQQNGKGSNMFFEGTAIYSYGYHFKIAEFITAPNGKQIVMFNPDGYSVTTSKHKSFVRSAIHGANIIECVEGSFRNWDKDKEIKRRINIVISQIEKAAKANKNAEYILNSAIGEINSLKEFTSIFQLQLPEIVSTWNIDELLPASKIAEIKAKEKTLKAAKKAKQQAEINEWLNNERENISVDDIYLRLNNNEVQTSLGAKVSPKEAKTLFSYISQNKPVKGFKIGYYTVNDFNGKVLHVGCHKLPIQEINRFATTINWI